MVEEATSPPIVKTWTELKIYSGIVPNKLTAPIILMSICMQITTWVWQIRSHCCKFIEILSIQPTAITKERNPMNKIDLIQTLSTTNGLTKIEATKIVSIFFNQMAAALEKGERVNKWW